MRRNSTSTYTSAHIPPTPQGSFLGLSLETFSAFITSALKQSSAANTTQCSSNVFELVATFRHSSTDFSNVGLIWQQLNQCHQPKIKSGYILNMLMTPQGWMMTAQSSTMCHIIRKIHRHMKYNNCFHPNSFKAAAWSQE